MLERNARSCAVPNSVLFLGRPGVGKTTVVREMARVLADDLHKRVVIVDTSNEIGGDGDVRPLALSHGFRAFLLGALAQLILPSVIGATAAGSAPGHWRRPAHASARPVAAAPRHGEKIAPNKFGNREL